MLSAHVLRIGFHIGHFDRRDVENWIDAQVESLASLPPELLDLVPLSARDDSEIDALLRRLAGPIAPGEDVRLLIDLVCDAFRRGAVDLREVARRIERIAWLYHDSLDTDVYSAASGLGDRFELATSGVYGTVADAEDAVREFVDAFGRPLTT